MKSPDLLQGEIEISMHVVERGESLVRILRQRPFKDPGKVFISTPDLFEELRRELFLPGPRGTPVLFFLQSPGTCKDDEQPSPAIGGAILRTEAPPGPQQGLLDQIAGIVILRGIARCHTMQPPQVRPRERQEEFRRV